MSSRSVTPQTPFTADDFEHFFLEQKDWWTCGFFVWVSAGLPLNTNVCLTWANLFGLFSWSFPSADLSMKKRPVGLTWRWKDLLFCVESGFCTFWKSRNFWSYLHTALGNKHSSDHFQWKFYTNVRLGLPTFSTFIRPFSGFTSGGARGPNVACYTIYSGPPNWNNLYS